MGLKARNTGLMTARLRRIRSGYALAVFIFLTEREVMPMAVSRHYCLAIAVLLAATFATTCAMAAVAPDAGQTDKSIQERKIVYPAQATPDLTINQEQESQKQAGQGPKIKVDHIRFTGQIIVPEEILAKQIQDGLSKEMSLADLENLTWRITRYLRSQGYLVATAYLPVQEVKDNTVEIAILIGQYGKISLRNQSSFASSHAEALLSAIHSGDYVERANLERMILLLDDTSGVNAKATLVRGEKPGTTDLIVDVSDTQKINGSLAIDNYGNWFTGKNRIGVTMDIHNPSGSGDQVTLAGTYAGSGMDNYNLTYQLPIGSQGGNWGVSFARTHYLLGKDFAILEANGTAITRSLFATYPFIRSRNLNLSGRIGFDDKKLDDRQDATNSISNKTSRLFTFGLYGDRRDTDGSGISAFNLEYSLGKLDIDTPDILVVDQLSANTNGSFSMATLSLIRVKQLSARLSYLLAFSGQLASKNLDSSEKLYLGGATGVRAYPQGEAPGDAGYILTGELHWNMPGPDFQLAAFIDTGRIKINKNPWDASTNFRTLSGAGLGVIWNLDRDYFLRMDYAWKLTSDPANSDTDRNGRLWLRCTRNF